MAIVHEMSKNSIHTATGVSPATMVFGHKLRSRLDFLNPKSSLPSSPHISQSEQLNEVRTNKCNINDVVLYKKYCNKKNYMA